MKGMKFILISAVFAGLLVTTDSCKKSSTVAAAPVNTLNIQLNGAHPAVDSFDVRAQLNNGDIVGVLAIVYLNHSAASAFAIELSFAPSDPLYGPGAVINFASSPAALIEYAYQSTNFVDAFSGLDPAGTLTITKNDVAAKRIEGTFSNCTLTDQVSQAAISASGSFGLNY